MAYLESKEDVLGLFKKLGINMKEEWVTDLYMLVFDSSGGFERLQLKGFLVENTPKLLRIDHAEDNPLFLPMQISEDLARRLVKLWPFTHEVNHTEMEEENEQDKRSQ